MPVNERHHRHHRHGSEAAAYLCGLLDDDKHDDGMMAPEYASNSSSCKNPIGIGESIAHDAHDDELQRFSKKDEALSPKTRDDAMCRGTGSTCATKSVAVDVPLGL